MHGGICRNGLSGPNSVVYKLTASPPCKSGLRGHIAKYAAEEKISPSTRGRAERAAKWPTFSLPPSLPLSPISILESKISAPIRPPPFCRAEQDCGPRLACLWCEFTQPLRRGSARSSLRHFPEKISPTTSRRRRRNRTPLFDKVSKKGIHLSRDRKGRISYHFGFGRRTKSFIIKSSPTNGTAAAVKECTSSSAIEVDNRIWVHGGHLLDRQTCNA